MKVGPHILAYSEYSYRWPPRPENAGPPELIPMYQRRGWWAQVKKNGTCTVIFCCGNTVIFKTRHNDDHGLWTPQQAHVDLFLGAPGWCVYVAELLHSKTKHIKNHLYLFDVLVFNGIELTGSTFAQRQDLLHRRFPSGKPFGLGAFLVDGSEVASVAKSYGENQIEVWRAIMTGGAEDEGIVFKDPAAKLAPCVRQTSNSDWQVKIRRPTKNYSF